MVATIDRLLPRSAVARQLGVSAELVDQLTRTGRLPYTSTALGKLYDPADVERLAEERAQRRGRRVRVTAGADRPDAA